MTSFFNTFRHTVPRADVLDASLSPNCFEDTDRVYVSCETLIFGVVLPSTVHPKTFQTLRGYVVPILAVDLYVDLYVVRILVEYYSQDRILAVDF